MNNAKLQEVLSDKAYVESIAKMGAEDAAKSLREKGVEVTADDLMKVHDFVLAHKEELQNGELSDADLAGIAGGASYDTADKVTFGVALTVILGSAAAAFFLW